MESIWHKTAEIEKREPLAGNITVDTAIIGGGLAGILTAYFLQKRGREAIVLEASRVGSGQTGNTTAKITAQHGVIYHRLIREFGKERAQQYADINGQAVAEYERVAKEERIDCQIERLPAYLYTCSSPEALEEEYRAYRALGFSTDLTTKTELPFPVQSALRLEDQAQFHPLRFLKGIAKLVPVFEESRVERVRRQELFTDRGIVRAKNIVFATHFPFPNFPGFYFIRMHQERSYVLALKGAQAWNGMYYGIDSDGLSFRGAGDITLLGGGGHRTGENKMGDNYETLWKKAQKFWPGCRISAAYSAQDCMTLDGVPFIGRFSPTRPNWYVATGFQKWGMTSAMAAAKLISAEIDGERGHSARVFSPRRFIPSAAFPTLVRETGKSGKGLLKQILYLPGKEFDWLPKGQGAIIRHCGKKRGAYRGEDGAVYLVSTRCPHLGCQLEWNPAERSWDCPCHGSRFDYQGNLLDNPAQTNLKA